MIQSISYYLKRNCGQDGARLFWGLHSKKLKTQTVLVQHQKKEAQRGSEISILVDFSEHTRTRP